MRRYTSLAVAVLVLGCTDDGSKTTAPQLKGAVVSGASASKDDNNGNHNGQRLDIVLLNGANERPTPRPSPATGQLILQLSDDGLSMTYILEITNITNANQAHIHIGPREGTGGIGVWLYPGVKARAAAPNGVGLIEKLSVQGTFTAADFIGPLAGKTMAEFLAIIETEGAYGNVHTNDGVGDQNTGPGDFPGGEIRGQLDGHGKH